MGCFVACMRVTRSGRRRWCERVVPKRGGGLVWTFEKEGGREGGIEGKRESF